MFKFITVLLVVCGITFIVLLATAKPESTIRKDTVQALDTTWKATKTTAKWTYNKAKNIGKVAVQ